MKNPDPAPIRTGADSPATVPSAVSRTHGSGSPAGDSVSIDTTAGETRLTIGANRYRGSTCGAEATAAGCASAVAQAPNVSEKGAQRWR